MIDAHVESFIWSRLLGYDVRLGHGRGRLGGRLYSQADLPRMVAAGMTGAVFSIATNPLRPAAGRARALRTNVAGLVAQLASADGVSVVADAAGYRRARAAGRFAAMVAVQGGNAAPVEALPAVVSRVTLVHLTASPLGFPSTPVPRPRQRSGGGRLTGAGRNYVAGLNQRRVLVDLAHVSRPGFWDALDVHDRDLPPVVSHTGVCGVHDSWRNLDDDQVRAVAARGGVVGVMYHCGFLGGKTADAVVAHLAHVIAVGGEDSACLGSDWDGFIVTPWDMRTAAELPVLLAAMRSRGWRETRMVKVMGANYLRALEAVRPES